MDESSVAQPIGRAIPPSPDRLRADAAAWVCHPALASLLERFGGPTLHNGDLDDVRRLATWTSQHWDFRAGGERNLVDPEYVVGELEQAVLAAAKALGLVAPFPPALDSYDHLVMLGGLVRACWWRPEYAAWLLDHAGVKAARISAITGFRPLNSNEMPLLNTFGLTEATNEMEAFSGAIAATLGTSSMEVEHESPPGTPDNSRELVAVTRRPDGTPVQFVVSPSSDPGSRRANTPDGYRYWAERLVDLRAGQTVLMVTSQIYVPFQHADAVRLLGLPYGCVVDTVGIDHRFVDTRGVAQPFRGVHYLQEINSAVRSTHALLLALDGA